MSIHNRIIGYTDKETVKLDFDNIDFKQVKYWANRAYNWFELSGFIILKSSHRNYHIMFNRTVDWSENLRIVAWVALESHNNGLHDWLIMQCIKEASTLRVSPKNGKSSPRIVYRYGREDEEIRNYLKYRNLIKRILKRHV